MKGLAVFVTILVACLASAPCAVAQNPSTQDQISNGPVAEYISDSNCTIGWSARTAGTMSLRYGTDRTKMTQTSEAMESKQGHHYHVQLDGLKPNTRYYFVVVNGSEAISGTGTFQTVSQGDSPVKSKATIPQ